MANLTVSRARNILQGEFGRVALLNMDRSLVPHAHRACHVLFKAGGADSAFTVNDQVCELTRDTAVVVNAWEQHSYTHRAAVEETQILALYIEPSWLASIDRQLIVSGAAGFFFQPSVRLNANIAQKAAELEHLLCSPDDQRQPETEALVFDLMVLVFDAFSNRRALLSDLHRALDTDYRVRRAINWLRPRLGQPLNLSAMAKEAGLSRSHLFARFRQTTGLTPVMFLNTLRMEAAHPLLTDQTKPLIEIGQRLGFNAQGNFSRFFREHQGISPSEYRRVTQRLS
ncbi:MAG: helix-turn-helix transcriptional regulator [Pseudomonadota bacterium]